MAATALEGGLQDAPRDAAYAFRALMNVMARPGRIETLRGATPPAPMSQAAGTLILTLTDPDTPVHLAGAQDTDVAREWIAFHTGAPFVDRASAAFVVGSWDDLLPLDDYRIGTPEYPDRSATLIVACDTLESRGTTLRGPGIRETAELSLPDPEAFARNNALFPLGLDFFFTCQDRVAALPRSTRIG